MAELTPTSSPFMLTSAPPELPGLIAASVWMASSTVFWLPASPAVDTGRLSALTMPVVTVPSRPSGEPIATTSWPTRRLAEDPRVIGVRPDTPWARTTAMSLAGSAPTTVNGAVRPSAKVTVVTGLPSASGARDRPGPSGADRAAATGESGGPPGGRAAVGRARRRGCWSGSARRTDRMMPEPSSLARPRSVSSLTTLGTTLAATCSTEPGGTLAAGTLGAAPSRRWTPVRVARRVRPGPAARRPRRYRPTPPRWPARPRSKLLRGNASGGGSGRDATGLLRPGPVGVVRRMRAAAALLLGGVAPVVAAAAAVG